MSKIYPNPSMFISGRLVTKNHKLLEIHILSTLSCWPDQQDRRSRPLCRLRNLRRHSASCRHEGFKDRRRHQQGRRSSDLPGRRLWSCQRPVRQPAGARKSIGESFLSSRKDAMVRFRPKVPSLNARLIMESSSNRLDLPRSRGSERSGSLWKMASASPAPGAIMHVEVHGSAENEGSNGAWRR